MKRATQPWPLIAPGVRLLRGVILEVGKPSPEALARATNELRDEAVSTLRADHASAATLGVLPVPGHSAVVIGSGLSRAPISTEQYDRWADGEPPGRYHPVVGTSFSSSPEVRANEDDSPIADEVPGLIQQLASAAWEGLKLDTSGLGEPKLLLHSSDGRAGEVVYGVTHWKPGSTYESGRIRTWTRDLGNDEVVRLVGVSFAKVDDQAPVIELPSDQFQPWPDAPVQVRKEMQDKFYTERPYGWWLVSEGPTNL